MPSLFPRAFVAPSVVAVTMLLGIPGRTSGAVLTPLSGPDLPRRSAPSARREPDSSVVGGRRVPANDAYVLPAKLRPNREYTYTVENLPTHRPAGATDADLYASIDRSFRQWEAFTAGPLGITFRAIAHSARDRADVTIRFRGLRGSADDDATSGVDCSLRCHDGDPVHIWLNDARTWTPTEVGGNGQGALELLVLHELGHLLGLSHFKADKCEPLGMEQARSDGDCLGARAVMTRFLAVTLPGPFVMPIRCTDLSGLALVYGVSMQAAGCADHFVMAPDAPSSVPAGPRASQLPRVQVLDASGRPVKNVVVAFSVSAGDATGLIQVTDSSGIATLGSWTLVGDETASAVAKVPGLGSSVRFGVSAMASVPKP